MFPALGREFYPSNRKTFAIFIFFVRRVGIQVAIKPKTSTTTKTASKIYHSILTGKWET